MSAMTTEEREREEDQRRVGLESHKKNMVTKTGEHNGKANGRIGLSGSLKKMITEKVSRK